MTSAHNLPNHFLDELCTKFGDAPIDAAVKAFGGRDLEIAAQPSPRWADVVGLEVAEWIAANFCGVRVSIPTLTALGRKRAVSAKHHEIQTSTEKPIDLARRYQISVRQVHKIKSMRLDPRIT